MSQNTLPIHIGFIMDGNRRWAKVRSLPAAQGHKAGADALEETVKNCFRRGIRHITFYAFSTENWNRSPAEISVLSALFSRYLDALLDRWENSDEEVYHRTRVRFLGDLTPFGKKFRDRAEKIERLSDGKEIKMTMNIALNYGGRADIVRAVNRAIAEGKRELTEEDISRNLFTAPQPDPDLIVRTGGEMRLSNFLLWQASYAEFYATPLFWPEFDEAALNAALSAYADRTRKFGGNEPTDGEENR